ncbi:myb-like protein D [Onthophagus taurus]|uniref:myb-like protein D n=1 Tax=Onthophagus taurus TaxID=166361 RepID=UPI0039BE56B6
MSNSSDSELELAQRSQSGSKISGSGQETEVNDKSPWDMMKSKQNKAFSKNYLQEIMNLDESNADVLKTIQMSNKKRAPDVNDAKSPGVSKKVSFSEHVQKREIIVSSSSSSDEESAKDSNKNVRKGILKRKNIDLEDSASTSDDGSIQSHANKLRQRKLLDGQGSSSESKKNSMLMCNEKSKFTVTKKKRDESAEFNTDFKLKKEKINCVSKEIISDNNSESSGNEFVQSPKLNKIIPMKNIKKEKLSSQSDSDLATTSLTNKRINHIKNIKKETTESQSDVSSDDDDDEESVDQNRNPSFNKNVSINSNKELSESTDSDNSEGRKKKVRLSHNSKHTLSKVPKHQKSMNYQSSDDDEEENTSTNNHRNSSINKNMSTIKTSLNKNLKEEISASDESIDEEENIAVKSLNKNKSWETNDKDGGNKKVRLGKSPIKNNCSRSENENELIGNVSTLAKICALNPQKSPKSHNDFVIDNKKNEFLKKKLSNFAKINNLSKIDSETYNLSKEIKKSGDEIFLAKIPKDLDPKLLVSGVINFNGESSKLEINENVYALHVNMDKNISNVLIDSSDNGDSFNILSLKCHGVISISKDTKIRKKSLKIKKYQQDDEVIEEPKNLKEQHLLLGHNYEDRINLDKWISDKLEGLITDFNKKRKQKRRSKSFNENKTPVEEENLDIFKLLDEHTDRKSSEENEGSVNKKKRKKKEVEENKVHAKIKTEMDESIDIINQMMMENNDNVDKTSLKKRSRSKSIFEEENSSPAKRKRSKSLSTLNPEDFDDTIPGDSTPIKSKKNKKSKTSLEHIVKEEMVSEDEFSLNKHKKAIVNSTMISVKEDNSIFDNEESFIPKPNDSSINRFIDDLVKEVEDKKKKVKKRSLGDVTPTSFDSKKKKKSL